MRESFIAIVVALLVLYVLTHTSYGAQLFSLVQWGKFFGQQQAA